MIQNPREKTPLVKISQARKIQTIIQKGKFNHFIGVLADKKLL